RIRGVRASRRSPHTRPRGAGSHPSEISTSAENGTTRYTVRGGTVVRERRCLERFRVAGNASRHLSTPPYPYFLDPPSVPGHNRFRRGRARQAVVRRPLATLQGILQGLAPQSFQPGGLSMTRLLAFVATCGALGLAAPGAADEKKFTPLDLQAHA